MCAKENCTTFNLTRCILAPNGTEHVFDRHNRHVLHDALVTDFHIRLDNSPDLNSRLDNKTPSLRFCLTLPHIVRKTNVETLHVEGIDFSSFKDEALFEDLVKSFRGVQWLRLLE